MIKARIFDIKHFAVHDGDGIRTTVFFKGCPLRCAWCHNPEGLHPATELALLGEKCTLCGACSAVCPKSAHKIADTHVLHSDVCISCGACVRTCHSGALTLYGREVTVDDILPELLEDRDFYGERGGVTLSGGECLIYPDFCAELLRKLKSEGINTAVDTSGAVSCEAIKRVLPYTDTFLYDVKAIDASVHKRCTGRTNESILENLLYLDSVGASIEIRVPFVPGYNDGEIGAIAEFIAGLNNVKRVRLLPYHRFYESKYLSLGYASPTEIDLPSEKAIVEAKKTLERACKG
jgi:pyruvate formate lyase activating enzyme